MSEKIPWGQYQKAYKEIVYSIRSGIAAPYTDNKITKFELTYDANGNVSTIKAYDNATLLYTLTFAYDANQNVASIVRS